LVPGADSNISLRTSVYTFFQSPFNTVYNNMAWNVGRLLKLEVHEYVSAYMNSNHPKYVV